MAAAGLTTLNPTELEDFKLAMDVWAVTRPAYSALQVVSALRFANQNETIRFD